MSERGNNNPLLITGMHRSGTSMVTRLLNLCGLHLGDPRRLLKAQPDNPQGFWENLDFVTLDDRILARMNGAWNLPPVEKPNMGHDSALLAEFGASALACVTAASGRPLFSHGWGWKDPRCSLLLPFWSEIVPDMKVLVCLRDPGEVSASLNKRNGFSTRLGLHLWQQYNERLEQDLLCLSGVESMVTHYEAILAHPDRELRRLTEWLGWPVTDELISHACESIKPELRHHRQGFGSKDVPPHEKTYGRLYERLCGRAGPNYSPFPKAGLVEPDIFNERVAAKLAMRKTPPVSFNPVWTEIPGKRILSGSRS
ncbi:MAG: sulfotransferase [Gemmatimonadales bacterium]|nr:sulfotransferase [Gemmatimonadales bacterium]